MRTLTPHQELGPRVALDVVAVEVAPPQLDVEPVFRGRRAVITILRVVEERGLGDLCDDRDDAVFKFNFNTLSQ